LTADVEKIGPAMPEQTVGAAVGHIRNGKTDHQDR
jgi:hypothetical protein